MDPQVQASFIPKRTLTVERGPKSGFSGLVMLVAILFFVASAIAAGAAFGYEQILNATLSSKKDSLAKYEAAYDLSTIQTLARMDSRITQARVLLNNHTAPSGFFLFLAQQTLSSVQFTSFNYTLNDDGSADIKLTGVANSFNTVALQSDQFGASKVLKDVIFSGLTIGDKGQVTFTVNATVDLSVILYSKNLNVTIPNLPADPNVSSSTAATTTSSTTKNTSSPAKP